MRLLTGIEETKPLIRRHFCLGLLVRYGWLGYLLPDDLGSRRFIWGVCTTGGEPTIHGGKVLYGASAIDLLSWWSAIGLEQCWVRSRSEYGLWDGISRPKG